MSNPGAAGREADGVLEIRVLGPLEVRIGSRPLVVDTRKALAILVLLAVEDRAFGRDELAALLWPESDDLSARGALRRTLSVLRAALGGRWLDVGRAHVTLDRGHLWLDLAQLEASFVADDITQLEAAAAVARGAFLAGFSLRDSAEFDDWRAVRAAAAERAVGRVLDRLADVAESSGDVAAATAAAAQRVNLDPLDEGSQRRLMAILARSGDRTGAIRQYRACVAVLERELGVPPLAETTALYEAIRDVRADPELEPRVVAQPTPAAALDAVPARLPLVGRNAELASILAAYRSATRDGRLALVTGEAGSGKSRLVEAAADDVRAQGGRGLIVRAYASEQAVAYGVIIGLLRAGFADQDAVERLRKAPAETIRELERLLPLPAGIAQGGGRRSQPGRWSDQPAARALVLDAIATTVAILTGGPVPGIVVAEDLQWADDASLEALMWLARRLASRPGLVVCTWRPEDLTDPGAFAATLEALPEATAVALGRLDLEAVRELATTAARDDRPAPDVQRLFEESEGLPLYVVEALATPSDQTVAGPARGVQMLLRERVHRVSDKAAQVLSAAAVIGRSFDISQVRGTSGRSEEEVIIALEELVRRGLVREGAGGPLATFDFAHSRLREAAYATTSLARRRLLHQRAAAALRADTSDRDPGRLARIAEHERAAGNEAIAAETFREAGTRARVLFAQREAASHLETALALGHPDVGGIQRELAEIRTAQGDYTGAIAALEAAAALSDAGDIPAIDLRLGRVHARRGDLRTAASHLDTAIDALEESEAPSDVALLVRALVERAVVAQRSGHPDVATTTAARALDLARTDEDDVGTAAAQRVLGLLARDRGDLDAARSFLRQSLLLSESDMDAGTAIAARNALALAEAASGDHGAAIALLEDAAAACRRIGERHLEGVVENNLADELHAVGRETEAMDHLKAAVTAFADVGRHEPLEPEIWKLVAW